MAPKTTAPSPRASLRCDIHPIFAHKNWTALAEEDYALLRPSLQLVTMYLRTPACLSFYATLLFGKRIAEAVGNEWIIRILRESPLTTYKAERIKDMFDELAGLYTFVFKEISSVAEVNANLWRNLTDSERAELEQRQRIEKPPAWSARMSLKHGLTVDQIEGEEKEFCWGEFPGLQPTSPDEDREKLIQDPRTRCTPCTVEIGSDFLSTLRVDGLPSEKALGLNFYLAVTLLHELAHSVECGRPEIRESEGRREVQEAIFPSQDVPELGWQFEKSVVGGAIYCTDDVLTFSDWPMKPTSLHYLVPLEFLIRIHQQDFWDAALSSPSPYSSLFQLPKSEPCKNSTELYRKYMVEHEESEDQWWKCETSACLDCDDQPGEPVW